MRKAIVAALTGVLMLAGAGMALADPGPNGNNDGGLCTAYFNGQRKGHDKNGYPGPFAALEETGRQHTDNDGVDNDRDGQVDEEGENQSLSAEENIFNFCNDLAWIGGNPEHGRFTCSDPGASSDPECTRNAPPGNSGGRP